MVELNPKVNTIPQELVSTTGLETTLEESLT